MTYFRMGDHTIIGAKRFHFRGRDGIGWFPLALATRLNWVLTGSLVALQTGDVRSPGFSAALLENVHTGLYGTQTVWVLYGQASRAISIG